MMLSPIQLMAAAITSSLSTSILLARPGVCCSKRYFHTSASYPVPRTWFLTTTASLHVMALDVSQRPDIPTLQYGNCIALCPPASPTLSRELDFTGSSVRFGDGSRWELTKPLSHLKYQQNNPPFEARQVFECVCIEDPSGTYAQEGCTEAVMKVKYQ